MAKPKVMENLKRSWKKSWKVLEFEEYEPCVIADPHYYISLTTCFSYGMQHFCMCLLVDALLHSSIGYFSPSCSIMTSPKDELKY